MADDNLDKYLENLGISMDDEEAPPRPEENSEAFAAPDGEDSAEDGAEGEADAAARCEAFLVNVLLNFDPAYAVEVSERKRGEIKAAIYGGDPGKIIGRGGRTLAALEYLTSTVINQGEERRIHVNIDVGDYKRRRDDRLISTARKAAARVRKTGFAVELEPMSAAERRVIHIELADNPYVYSESTGEGKNRRLVVKPR
jgi:spoIIIJ-associated protein